MRNEAIAQIDQRISNVTYQGSFSIEQRSGLPVQRKIPRSETRFGAIKPSSTAESGREATSQWHDQSLESSGLEILITAGWLGSRPHGLQQRPLHTGTNQDRCRGCGRPGTSQWRRADLGAAQPPDCRRAIAHPGHPSTTLFRRRRKLKTVGSSALTTRSRRILHWSQAPAD